MGVVQSKIRQYTVLNFKRFYVLSWAFQLFTMRALHLTQMRHCNFWSWKAGYSKSPWFKFMSTIMFALEIYQQTSLFRFSESHCAQCTLSTASHSCSACCTLGGIICRSEQAEAGDDRIHVFHDGEYFKSEVCQRGPKGAHDCYRYCGEPIMLTAEILCNRQWSHCQCTHRGVVQRTRTSPNHCVHLDFV